MYILDVALHMFHVATAAATLVLGLVAMRASKQRPTHPRIGTLYFFTITAACSSAAVLALMHWDRSWIFLPVALATWALAVLGFVSAKRRGRGWLVAHVAGQCSSWNGMVIAFVINNWKPLFGTPGVESPVAFLIPGSVGTLAVLWIMREVALGRRPRAAGDRR